MVDTPAENIGSFKKPTRARRAPAAPKVADRIDEDSKAILEGMAKNPSSSLDDFAEQHQQNLVSPNRDHFEEMRALHGRLSQHLDALKATAVDDPAEKIAAGTGASGKQKETLYNQVDGLLSQAADSIGNAQNTHFSGMFSSVGQTPPVTSLNENLFKRARKAVDNPAPNEVVSPSRVNKATTSDEHMALAGNILGQVAHTLVTYGAALDKPFANRVGKHFGTVGDVAEGIARHYKLTWGDKSPAERMTMGQEMPGKVGAQARMLLGAPERDLAGFTANQRERRGAISTALMTGVTSPKTIPAVAGQPDRTMEPAMKAAVKHVVTTNPFVDPEGVPHSRLEGGVNHPEYSKLRREHDERESAHYSSVFSSVDLSDPEKYLRENNLPVPERGPGAVAAAPEIATPFAVTPQNVMGKKVADQETAFATYKENRAASDAIDRQNELEDQQKAAEERRAAAAETPAPEITYPKKAVTRFELAHNRVIDTFNKVNLMAKAAVAEGTALHPDVPKLLKEAVSSLRAHQQVLNQSDSPDAFSLNTHVTTAMDKVHNAALRLRGSGYQNDSLNKLISTGAAEDARAEYESATMRQSGAYQMPVGGGDYRWSRGITGGYLGLASAAFPKSRAASQAAALGVLAKRATPKYMMDLPGNSSLVVHNMDTDTTHSIGDVLPAGRYRVLAHASDSRMHIPTMSPSITSVNDKGKKKVTHGTPAIFTPILGPEDSRVGGSVTKDVAGMMGSVTEYRPDYFGGTTTFDERHPSALYPSLVTDTPGVGPAKVGSDGTFTVTSPQKLHVLQYAAKVVREGMRPGPMGMQGWPSVTVTKGQRHYWPGDRLHNYQLTDEVASPFPTWGEPGSAKPRTGRTKGAFLGADLDEQAEELLAKQRENIAANPTAGPTERSESGDFVENTGERSSAAGAFASGAAREAASQNITDEEQFTRVQDESREKQATNEDVQIPGKSRGKRLRDEFGY